MNLLRPPASKSSEGAGELWIEGVERGERGVVLARCDDEELVRLYQGGEDRAFEMLVERYQDSIYNFVFNNVREEETAKDLAQEAFVRAFLRLSGFRRESSFKTWLFRIARNLCVDTYRRRRRQREGQAPLEVTDERGEEIIGSEERGQAKADALRELIAQETREQVSLALKRLPEKMRSALILYNLEGLSCEEVARVVGCPVGTVKSRLFNGRLRLREMLRPYVEDGESRLAGAKEQ